MGFEVGGTGHARTALNNIDDLLWKEMRLLSLVK
jgi:hypothetical protein